MPRKSAPKRKTTRDDPEQSKRFLETAKLVGASEDPKDFDRALKTIAPKKRKKAYL